jgi:hypothetical protein
MTKLKGGLGNQLFQYACGRALSIRNGEELKLDITEYADNNTTDVARHYSLSHFNIKATIATIEEILKIKYSYGLISKATRIFRTKILREFYIGFNKKILTRKGNSYLDGFFQTEKYFLDKEKEIRDDLKLKAPLNEKAKEISSLIKDAQQSISLHVRRGDYISHPVSRQYNGTCSLEYYTKALELIVSKIGDDITIFVFSDDIAWVKENMPLPYPAIYVSSPDIPDYEEMVLMSMCNHNIIANSSFSWWGAWLNPDPSKIVIAPKRWTLKEQWQYRDIVPPSWIRL